MRAPLIPYVNLPLQANFLAHIPHLIEPPVNFFLLSFFWILWSNETQTAEAFQDSSAGELVCGPVGAGDGVPGGSAVTHSFKNSVQLTVYTD
jgi:hypothetical protein